MPWKDLTVLDQRLDLITLTRSGALSMSEACRRLGVSRKTGYKWLARVQGSSDDAEPAAIELQLDRLQDRSRRPANSPSRTSGEIEAAVLQVRLDHPAWGGRKIAHVLARDRGLQIAPSTVTHVLHRHGLISDSASAAATPWQRFEHARPNSLWQMDFKGHFAMDAGRCHPLTVLDDHSRFNLSLHASPNELRETVQACLQRAFSTYGLPDRINVDNGSPWGCSGQGEFTALSAWIVRLGIDLSYSAPLHPQTNGKDERFHRSLKAEVLHRRYADIDQVQLVFDRWRQVYNFERPHQALGMQTPSQRYQPSTRSMPAALPDIDYPSEDLVRKVDADGRISVHGHEVLLTRALAGHPVALRPGEGQGDGVYDIYFCHHKLKEIDLRQRSRVD